MNDNNTINLGISRHERILAVLSHISIFMGFAIPFAHIIAPFVFYILINKDHPFAKEHSRQALAFSISITIYFIIGLIAMIILTALILTIPLAVMTVAVLLVMKLAAAVLILVASYKASKDLSYKYPFSLSRLRK